MAVSCIIIDDEPLAVQVIENHLKQVSEFELFGSFQNPVEAFEYLKNNTVDLIFSDIEMPLMNGIEFVKNLQNPPKVIFTTAYRNYAIESYELDVIDYLLKPISFSRFFKALQKYQSLSNGTQAAPPQEETLANDHLYVNTNKKYVKVLFEDILYVESLKDYVRIHTVTERVITKTSLSDFVNKLPSHFLRVHRSFVVNKNKITAFTAQDIEIESIEIPMGSSYKTEVLEQLKK